MAAVEELAAGAMQELARKHLWMLFTRMGAFDAEHEIVRRGLICRADDRGDPVIQLAPPLIAGPEQFEEIRAALRPSLEQASQMLGLRG